MDALGVLSSTIARPSVCPVGYVGDPSPVLGPLSVGQGTLPQFWLTVGGGKRERGRVMNGG